ncbi:hypothetical protein CPLU01_02619 [Colletotrichum plurivorum]|uniref:Uncharacterized protein n=1 Tax=Colletotrichum plurivorum TaxID=2175906 RepID=A0A8H6KVW0_9PEZI|nr:hypothetical protein CPLU01_02619 [Colletotrichum plurivorum]
MGYLALLLGDNGDLVLWEVTVTIETKDEGATAVPGTPVKNLMTREIAALPRKMALHRGLQRGSWFSPYTVQTKNQVTFRYCLYQAGFIQPGNGSATTKAFAKACEHSALGTEAPQLPKDRWNFYRRLQGPLARLDWDPYALENDLPEDEDEPRDERFAYPVHLAKRLQCSDARGVRQRCTLRVSMPSRKSPNHIRTLEFSVLNSQQRARAPVLKPFTCRLLGRWELAIVYSQYD